jgi:hypothetical protein
MVAPCWRAERCEEAAVECNFAYLFPLVSEGGLPLHGARNHDTQGDCTGTPKFAYFPFEFLLISNTGPSRFCKSEYQPNFVGVAFRNLFAVFAKKRVRFTLAEYENMPGSFFALWKERMLFALQRRVEFARNPNRAYFDPDEDWKLRNQAVPEFDLEGNFDDLMSVYYWALATCFMLRGTKDVCRASFLNHRSLVPRRTTKPRSFFPALLSTSRSLLVSSCLTCSYLQKNRATLLESERFRLKA